MLEKTSCTVLSHNKAFLPWMAYPGWSFLTSSSRNFHPPFVLPVIRTAASNACLNAFTFELHWLYSTVYFLAPSGETGLFFTVGRNCFHAYLCRVLCVEIVEVGLFLDTESSLEAHECSSVLDVPLCTPGDVNVGYRYITFLYHLRICSYYCRRCDMAERLVSL